MCTRIEVWHRTRRVNVGPQACKPNDAIVTDVQAIVLERELALRDSKFAIAESGCLLKQT
jgi:hypothetical protein